MPRKGPYIVACNHVSLGDPTVLGVACYRPMHFMAKKELFENKRWGWWFKWTHCIPISRDKRDYRATRQALRRLKEGRCVALFPEGTRSESGELKQAELGIGFLVAKAKVPVIPIYIAGTQEALPVNGPYRIGKPVKVYIGRAIDFKSAEKFTERRKKYRLISDKIMEEIARLKQLAVCGIR